MSSNSSSFSQARASASRQQARASTRISAALRGRASGYGGDGGDAAGKALELRRIVQKKERLKYTVDRLELQSTQRERQLRKSMAAQ